MDFGEIQNLDTGRLFTLFLVAFIGLILSAVFSGSEVAVFSLSGNLTSEQKELAKTDRPLQRILFMLESPRRLLATILIGNTVTNIVTAVIAAVITGQLLILTTVPDYLVYGAQVVVLTVVILILAEITPKILALNHSLAVARAFSSFLFFFFILFKPLAVVLASSAKGLESRLPRPDDSISSEDLRTIAEVGELQGSIHGDEREIIENVIEFGNTTAREIMTSRVNIVAISTDESFAEVLELIRKEGLSRMPLYENDLDHIIGVVYAKDLLPFIDSPAPDQVVNWKSLARKTMFIPPSKKLDDLLRDFQREKTHFAIVVDEYGGTEGIVSLDDLLEEIVGEINDEYGGQEALYTRRKNGDYIFDAKIDLDDVSDILGVPLTSDEDEYETLGGLVYHLLERIPEIGEKVDFKNLTLTVHKVEKNRVTKVVVSILPPDPN
ncbi:MAG: HlyC/CorC family transporter [Bacteroidetes bacterium]|nr:HlyC/CorC family transporter [Bacteroidota bacterium]